MRLILASTSPRRREILALLGLAFEVVAPPFEERVSDDLPIEKEVLDFALGKARSVAAQFSRSLVIGGDTMIDLEGKKIGKPADRADARRILSALAGKIHRIYTSVALCDGAGGPGMQTVEKVSVRMRPFAGAEIERYLDCREYEDKAGAYSIQGEGRKLIEAIEGDYLAAVGMPLRALADYFRNCGVIVPNNVDKLYTDRSHLNWRQFT